MPQSNAINRRIILNSRPVGAPTADDFRIEELAVPVPASGQVLLRPIDLSLDPCMRGCMSDAPSYAAPVTVGAVMVGATISSVQVTEHPDYSIGDLVLGYSGWQDYAVSDGTGLSKLDPRMTHPSLALGVLGMPGFTGCRGGCEWRGRLCGRADCQAQGLPRCRDRRGCGQVPVCRRGAGIGCVRRSPRRRLPPTLGRCLSKRNRRLLRKRRWHGLRRGIAVVECACARPALRVDRWLQ
jgi:hypothetical protein